MKWGELITLEYGKPVSDKTSIGGPVPVYGTNGQIGTSFLDPLCKHPSFIIGRKGAYRGVHYSSVPFSVIDTAFFVEPISDMVDLKWAYYKFLTYDINRMDSGSAIPSTDRYEIYGIDVKVPSIKEQKNVVSILESLDKKIEQNAEVNDNLEQQAQTLFKSWFIYFEPFGGKKPDNWGVKTLGEVSIMGAGGDKPEIVSSIPTPEYPYPIFSNGISDYGLYGYTNKPKITEESVTVSARGTIGFVCLRHVPYIPIVRLVTLIPKQEMISAKYLYLFLKQIKIAGTGSTQQQLTVPDFKKTEIDIPSIKVMYEFTSIVSPLFSKIWGNEVENATLSNMRDALLPRLMSGELNVSNIDL